MKCRFSPGVVLPDGRTVYPPGWMWVLAFALRGVQWAMDEASKPGFREQARLWMDVDRADDFEDGAGI